MQVLASAGASELAPATGLVLRLAENAPTGACRAAVHAARVHAAAAAVMALPAVVEAMRLAVSQHVGIAQAFLDDIQLDCGRQVRRITEHHCITDKYAEVINTLSTRTCSCHTMWCQCTNACWTPVLISVQFVVGCQLHLHLVCTKALQGSCTNGINCHIGLCHQSITLTFGMPA